MSSESEKSFGNLCNQFTQLMYAKTEGERRTINKILDDLNILDYRYTVITNSAKAVLLVNQCCTVVSTEDSYVVSKCCQLITNLINRQHIQIEGKTLNLALQWSLQALRQCNKAVFVDILVALDALIRSNTATIHTNLDIIIGSNSPLLECIHTNESPEIILLVIHCLEACTLVPENYKSLDVEKYNYRFVTCAEVFLKYLLVPASTHKDELFYYKLLASCINGLQNIVIQNEQYLTEELGVLLAITKTYMVYDIKNVEYIFPVKLMPSALSIPEPSTGVNREKKGGKVTKQRKQRYLNSKKEFKKPDNQSDLLGGNQLHGYVPASCTVDVAADDSLNTSFGTKLKTSDSDYSDNEGVTQFKLNVMKSRIRQTALKLFLTIVKSINKRTVFSYWSSFIPDGSPVGTHSLTTCVLKDPSSRGRMAALNVLLTLLDSSKLYLSQAEYSERITAFTPFSVTLGCMIAELHKCLSLALNENSIPVLTQTLKCLAALVQATPYHRLKPGLLTKTIRNVKLFIRHKDSTVQVAALIVLGCVVASEPVLPETTVALLKHNISAAPTVLPNNPPQHSDSAEKVINCSTPDDIEEAFEYAHFSSEEDDDITTPLTELSVATEQMPWLLRCCLLNLGVVSNLEEAGNDGNAVTASSPVKLESLQVISALSRCYFEQVLLPWLQLITRGVVAALSNHYADIRLHAGRAIDFLGQAINQYLTVNNAVNRKTVLEQSTQFWMTLLSGPLTSLIQNEQQATLKSVTCDCFGSIGAPLFEQLPRDLQIFCVTLLFSCARDREPTVKGAAVRALAICVLYPSLREDSGFVTDTAEMIHESLKDPTFLVKMKTSWSLGNLSDALVLNNADPNIQNEELSNDLLLRLIQDGIDGCKDNDKIKSNCIRALGNLLQLVNGNLSENELFVDKVESGVLVLVKNATTGSNMKVRWNACYAIGNILKNDSIFKRNSTIIQQKVLPALTELVFGFRNFKVRINAALALSSPTQRNHFGSQFFNVWNALLSALENSENMEDFSEYKHRDNLVDQICLTFGYLVTLLRIDDITSISDSIELYLDLLHTQVHKVLERLLPEKSTVLFSACAHIDSLQSKCETNEQKQTVKNITDIFTIIQ